MARARKKTKKGKSNKTIKKNILLVKKNNEMLDKFFKEIQK